MKPGKERHFPSRVPLHLPAGAASPAPGNYFPQIRQMLCAGRCFQEGRSERCPCTSQGASDGGSWRESALTAGGGKWESFPCSLRKRHQKAPELGCNTHAEAFVALPCPPSLPAPRRPIPLTQSKPAAFASSAFAGGCGEMASLLFPSENYGASWISDSSQAAGLIGSCSLQKEGGGSCPMDTPGFVLPCCPWGSWRTHPSWPSGMSARSGAWEKAGGGFWCWVCGREGKGKERRM